jgi:hypothetical protein
MSSSKELRNNTRNSKLTTYLSGTKRLWRAKQRHSITAKYVIESSEQNSNDTTINIAMATRKCHSNVRFQIAGNPSPVTA